MPWFSLPARPSSLVTFLSPSTSELLAYHTESLPAGSAILPFLKPFPSLPSVPWSPLLAQELGDPPAPCLVPAVPCVPHHTAPFLGLPPDPLPPFAQAPSPIPPRPPAPGAGCSLPPQELVHPYSVLELPPKLEVGSTCAYPLRPGALLVSPSSAGWHL